MKKPTILILSVLLLDQILKFWVKTNMIIGEEIHVFDWFILHFTENNGMAFGLEFGGKIGKYILSILRIFAIGAIFWYLKSLTKQNVNQGVVLSISLILAGAIGNMIDSAFYGLIFSESFNGVATFLEGGYAAFLQGRVVDIFYFPFWEGYLPNWVPFFGGNYFVFFQHIFNIADAAISVGVINLLIFHKAFFK